MIFGIPSCGNKNCRARRVHTHRHRSCLLCVFLRVLSKLREIRWIVYFSTPNMWNGWCVPIKLDGCMLKMRFNIRTNSHIHVTQCEIIEFESFRPRLRMVKHVWLGLPLPVVVVVVVVTITNMIICQSTHLKFQKLVTSFFVSVPFHLTYMTFISVYSLQPIFTMNRDSGTAIIPQTVININFIRPKAIKRVKPGKKNTHTQVSIAIFNRKWEKN